MPGRHVVVSHSFLSEKKGPLMTWKNGLPTPEKPKKWTATEVWATIGGLGSVALIAAAFYYGFQL